MDDFDDFFSDNVMNLIRERGARGAYSPEDIALVAHALDMPSVAYGTSLGATDAQWQMMHWLQGAHGTLDEFFEGLDQFPVLACLVYDEELNERWDILGKIIELLYERIHEECGNDATDFLKEFIDFYATINCHSDTRHDIERVGREFICKVPEDRRQEFADYADQVFKTLDEDDAESEYIGDLIRLTKRDENVMDK